MIAYNVPDECFDQRLSDEEWLETMLQGMSREERDRFEDGVEEHEVRKRERIAESNEY